MQVGVLGPLRVTAAGGAVVPLGGARLRALLIRLALDAGAVVRAESLVTALWGEAVPADQANALQSLVSRLRRALPGDGLIVSEAGGYRLAVDPDAVDAVRFERLARAGRAALGAGEHRGAARRLGEALALWRGPALADAGDAAYAVAAAARLEELRLAAAEDRCDAELAGGRPGAVLADLEALAAEHPLRERTLGLLMRARYAAGRQAEALAAYEEYRARLAGELGVDPSPALRDIHLAVLRAEPAPPPTTGAAPGNLPAPLTTFVGRDEELALVAERLGEGRLVTLVGPGGAGKTRLATTAAAKLADGYPGGAWLVELASVTDPDDVPQAVLGALGHRVSGLLESRVQPAAPRDAPSMLTAALATAPTLLLLDNCEHVVEAAARLAEHLLARCPGLRVLATSREPLALVGESLCPVPPLGVPAPDVLAAEADGHPAVRLLADRAAAVRPGFTVHEGNVAAVVEICRRLDGLPLAIELAAARLRSLDPAHLAARLDDRFRLLTGGSRTALPRHQTLRAVVAWSWELLTDEERELADRLAVFAGGVTPESVEGGCGVPAAEALDLLASLADKSLLQPVEGDGEAGGPRFRMLETLREYGLERLAADGRAGQARDAHMAYFLRLAETAEPHLRGPGQLPWIATLIAERDNLLAALHHAVGTGDAETAVRLAAALGLFWTMRGNHAEAANWLRLALAVPGEAPHQARIIALAFAVLNSAAGGEPTPEAVRELRQELDAIEPDAGHPVLAALEPGLAMFAERAAFGMAAAARRLSHPDPWARAMLRLMRAAILENEGEPAGMRKEIDLAVAGFREAGDRWGLAMALSSRGMLYRQLGELDEAAETLREAMRLMRELRTESDVDQLRVRLAVVRAQRGEEEAARAELGELASRAERHGSGYLAALARLALGDLLRQAGERAAAADSYARALTVMEQRAFVQPQLAALLRAGAALVGPPGETAELLAGALEEAWDVADMPVAAMVGVAVAQLCARRGDPVAAAAALGAAAALRGVPDETHPDVAALRPLLSDPAGAAAYAAAAALGRAEAVRRLRLAAVGADGEREEDGEYPR
ncbi:BTAD domain-containing putative transcriptional regulator [Streptomyces litchfieldiae]|uniref:BTAD domain-containing putative transcriptional regulator n=1 Tax=Streptomyces litchfieldiae TaxID=3075543 RepID=A0ABU2MIK0_9ACTN|nr:BTAD domain-containing putative transcriptional regulator [Streptomyces sp. DSM 44938]MDT0341350.1 BTAD domain-containing putative transcriptional regulator [Streptomyces sp. DSM 44938]